MGRREQKAEMHADDRLCEKVSDGFINGRRGDKQKITESGLYMHFNQML